VFHLDSSIGTSQGFCGPREAAEESRGAQRSQGRSPGERGAAWEKPCELLREGGGKERDRQIPLKRSVMHFFHKDSGASV